MTDWENSMLLSYGKGARTWERHIDIDYENVPVSKYCSLPHQADTWFKAFHKSKEMCGGSTTSRRNVSVKERKYLDELVRGVYAKKELKKGYVFSSKTFDRDFYLAIPLHKGQLSCREIINGESLTVDISQDDQLTIEHIDGPYKENESLRKFILERGK